MAGPDAFENSGAHLVPLERAELVSRALTEAARRSRFSFRTRRRMTAGGGFSARRGEAFVQLFYLVTFVFVVAIPALFGIIYFGFVASDQYVAEAKFTVRVGESPMLDGIGAFTGLPAAVVIQDSQVVTNYITSRTMVERLQERVHLRELYSLSSIDFLSRLNPAGPVEKLVSYWKWMVNVSITMPSGIIVTSVRAFRPHDAADIMQAVLALSEELVNDMNERIRRDTVSSAEQELARAMERLNKTRMDLEKGRNAEGILDIGQTSTAINELITSVMAERIKMQQEYDTQSRNVSEQAPQMRALKTRIAAAQQQIEQLQAQLTTQGGNSNRVLSGVISKFSELGLEHQIAQRQYTMAFAKLEVTRAESQRKQVYLTTFVKSVMPEEPQYPRRVLYPFLIIVSGVALWGTLCGAVTWARTYMA